MKKHKAQKGMFFFCPIIIIVSFALLFLVSSCTTTNDDFVKGLDYYTGREGLEMEFFEDNPPDIVYPNSEFSIYLQVQNKGAFDINDGNKALLYISYDAFYLELKGKNTKSFEIVGKSIEYPQGGIALIDFPVRARTILGERESPETSIFASLCYPYRTQAKASVCFDASYYDIKERAKPCDREYVDFNQGGQGAPLVVESIEAKALAAEGYAKPFFKIDIRNAQDGVVLNVDEQSSFDRVCGESFQMGLRGDIDQTYFNRVDVKAVLSSGVELECVPETVNLRDGRASTICYIPDAYLENNKGRVFSTPLSIYLDYAYLDTISKGLTLERIIS